MRASVGVFTPKLTIETNTKGVTIITVAGITAEVCLVLPASLLRLVWYCWNHCRGLFATAGITAEACLLLHETGSTPTGV